MTYIKNVRKNFHMDKSYPLSSPMVVCSLEISEDMFNLKEENEVVFSSKVLYLNVIDILIYHINHTCLIC